MLDIALNNHCLRMVVRVCVGRVRVKLHSHTDLDASQLGSNCHSSRACEGFDADQGHSAYTRPTFIDAQRRSA